MVTGDDKYVHAPTKVGTDFALNFDQRVALSSTTRFDIVVATVKQERVRLEAIRYLKWVYACAGVSRINVENMLQVRVCCKPWAL